MSDMLSLVSIIIPAYNVGRYIGKCLDSVLSQTYRNIEVIIINDGSKDDSLSIIQAYAAKDHRVRLIDKPNEGVSVARNKGLEAAQGDFILFVDGDDWIDENMLERLMAMAVSNNSDYVGGGFVFEDIETGRKRFSPTGFTPVRVSGKGILSYYLSGQRLWSSVWGAIFSRKVIEQGQLRFDKDIKFDEDCFFVMQFMSQAETVMVCQDHYYHVLVRSSSVTRSSLHELDKEKRRPDYEGYLKSHGLYDENKEAFDAWVVRSSNHELFHLALRVDYRTYKKFYITYVNKNKYRKRNTFRIRSMMNTRNHLMSIIGLFPFLTWFVLQIPRWFGKEILT